MKEYKEGKQKTATMVNKRRLSPPSIYEGSSPVYFSVAFYRKILFLPPSSALLWPPFWVTLARVRFQPFWTTKILETSSFSRQTAPPTGPSFQLERREPRGGRRGPVSNSFFWRLHFVRQREGKRRKRKKKRKERKEKTGGNCVFSSCEKSLYLDGDPFENVSPVKKIGPWPAVGFRIIGEKRNLERWKVEMGGGGWRGTSRRENRNGGRVGRFVGPILLDTTRLFDKWCRVESIEIGRNEKYSVFFEINEEEF